MFKRILVANRGEIAIRIMRACRELGVETVAIFSEADRAAWHVRFADYAYPIGPPPSAESYLSIDRVIEAAQKSGAEAIHPGYGFLAENPAFARAVHDAGLVFMGPSPKTIELLGDKMAARRAITKAGVPVVPGVEEAIGKPERAREIADSIGLPILIKAAAGGGGKGMRIVRTDAELADSVRAAQSEAQSAFGDGRIYIEKYLDKPRHVEIQIMADEHRNVVHLGERECSIQRRHQKVVEESPSPIVDKAMRQRMGEAAIAAAKAAEYENAGTVEFLVDKDKNFYFLEVNTRLQVEHPVTEMVTGLDLAKEQIRIASGERLGFSQEDVDWRGAAIECRIYAEDPDNNFLPSVGTVVTYREPSGPGIRVDSGLSEGDDVTIYYDPLISKLIAWGKDRTESIARMKRALSEYTITGVKTTIPFHRKLMDNDKFLAGEISTHFINEEFSSEKSSRPPEEIGLFRAMAVFSCAHEFMNKKSTTPLKRPDQTAANSWKLSGRRRNVLKI